MAGRGGLYHSGVTRPIAAVAAALLLAVTFALADGGAAGTGQEGPIPDPSATLPVPSDADLAAARAAVAKTPADPGARFRLGSLLYAAGKKEDAAKELERAIAIGPANEARLMNLAIVQADLLRFADATATYERLLKLAPAQPRALNNLGNIALRQGDTAKAAEFYTRAVAADPGYVMARYKLGYTLQALNRRSEAVAAFEMVLEREPATEYEQSIRLDALAQIGQAALADGAWDAAIRILTEVAQADPEHPFAHHALGQALIHAGRVDEGRQELQRHFEIQARRLATAVAADTAAP